MKPQKETLRHASAFETYYSLGDQRSYSQVARKFKVTPTAVTNWSLQFNWGARVQERDKEIGQRMAQRAKSDIFEMQSRHLNISKAIQQTFVKRLMPTIKRDGKDIENPDKVKVDAGDFIRAAEYESKLLGYSPDQSATAKDIGEIIRLITVILQTNIHDSCPYCSGLFEQKKNIAAELNRLAVRYAQEPPNIDALKSVPPTPNGPAQA
jgi:transposase-like protein